MMTPWWCQVKSLWCHEPRDDGGYTATAGEQWARAELCQEAMRAEFEHAADLTSNEAERAHLLAGARVT
jgi:hypothetical protein